MNADRDRLTRKSRQLMGDRDRFLNDKDYENFFDIKNKFSTSIDNDCNRFRRIFIETVENDKKKWMLINEIKMSKYIKPGFFSLRNVFGN